MNYFVTEKLKPGKIAPPLAVPKDIVLPEYVGKKQANEGHEPWIQTTKTIEAVRKASKIAANAIKAAEKIIQPGITTNKIDETVHNYLISQNAYPSTLGYLGFPKSCCTSINEVICHGIPDSTVLKEGDIVNVDVTAYLDGAHGDTNATFLVGKVAPEVDLLVDRTKNALMRAIKAVKPGRQFNIIGKIIEAYADRFGYGVVRDFTGHGIGTTFHNGLVIEHYDNPNFTDLMEEGMIFTIEPMLNTGGIDYEIWEDGWTVVTKDGSYSAQFEHTLLVTAEGAEILTLADE